MLPKILNNLHALLPIRGQENPVKSEREGKVKGDIIAASTK
jgi:hypothetical protein